MQVAAAASTSMHIAEEENDGGVLLGAPVGCKRAEVAIDYAVKRYPRKAWKALVACRRPTGLRPLRCCLGGPMQLHVLGTLGRTSTRLLF